MAAKWVEQGWVSVRDLAHLGWSESSISSLKRAVPEEDSGIPGLGKARDLSEVNGWARDNGEPIVSSKALGGSKVRSSAESSRRHERGSHSNSKLNSRGSKQQKQTRRPPRNQAARAVQSTQAQLAGRWFNSKKDANSAGFLSAKDLEGRFWTESLIAKLLGEPEGFGENHFGPMPVRYWRSDLVLSCESSPAFDDHMSRSLKRRKISWEHGVSSIASSNRELELPLDQSTLVWATLLGDILEEQRGGL